METRNDIGSMFVVRVCGRHNVHGVGGILVDKCAKYNILSFFNFQEVRESCTILYITRHQIWRHLGRFREFLSPAFCTANCFFTQQALTSYVGLGGIAGTG